MDNKQLVFSFDIGIGSTGVAIRHIGCFNVFALQSNVCKQKTPRRELMFTQCEFG